MQVEVWSDIMCPWCYIGKRRLAAALASFDGRDDVQVTWRSYELRPEAPRIPGLTLGEGMVRWRGMGEAEVVKLFAWIRKLGAAECLELNLETVRPVNSFDAHRLTHLAGRHGLRDQMTERLFRAHLTENVNIADLDVLVALAAEVGLDNGEVRTVLAGDAYAADVIEEARRSGISSVPTFVFNRRYEASGARDSAELLRILEQVRAGSVPTPQL